ncbi:MAG: glycosylase [Lachnospiraceae bacterium]|nr:glycosylase [Lachnospiraceae bacterium]
MIQWLKDAQFYEIYPQSFKDSNGDGIGDIQGIISELDYIKDLGMNALWINPWYDSPFKDAGYDVRDYKKVASRYGTNEDAKQLFEEAHKRGIHVLLDLVPGHTSEEHPWFLESGKVEKNEYSGRFIWTDFWYGAIPGHPYIGGEYPRSGVYMLNFFKCQPALNYGFRHPSLPWQKAMDDPDCMATREAMKDVIRFWLSMGCDGFRVDMADSLVKDDDPDKNGTCTVWQDIFASVRKDFPEAAFVAEWSNPELALCGAGFDMDFYLDHVGNGYNTLVRDYESQGEDNSYFRTAGDGDITRFLADYLPKYEKTRENGYIAFISGNHDTPRIKNGLADDEIKLFYALMYTLPGVPFLYYGDEIGMHYRKDLPTKEGGYSRTGSRTPMQWTDGETKGFSAATPDKLYLPVDPAEDAPSVERQKEDPASLYHTVKALSGLRHDLPELQADGDFAVILGEKGEPFVYRRGNFVCAINPTGEEKRIPLKMVEEAFAKEGRAFEYPMTPAPLCGIGKAVITQGTLVLGARSFALI